MLILLKNGMDRNVSFCDFAPRHQNASFTPPPPRYPATASFLEAGVFIRTTQHAREGLTVPVFIDGPELVERRRGGANSAPTAAAAATAAAGAAAAACSDSSHTHDQ